MGIAMSCSLYEACFAFLTTTQVNNARRAITFVTLAAGFGGTISFSSAHFLTSFWLEISNTSFFFSTFDRKFAPSMERNKNVEQIF